MIQSLIYNLYGLTITDLKKTNLGAGSDTYFITCEKEKYVVKFPCESEMNHPDIECALCEFLLSQGIAASEFIKNISGDFVSVNETGRKFHVQKFAEGRVYGLNEAPDWLLLESAKTLGLIHTALIDYPALPMGLGKDFFAFMTPEKAIHSYKNSLDIAGQNAHKKIEKDLIERIRILENFPDFKIDMNKLTCRNTHGDYFLSQLICGENSINAVIDWTTACVHPVVWEIIRSYVYASPSCINGEINLYEFMDYVVEYLHYASLNQYDLAMMAKVFYTQIAVCDYYSQYYQSTADNRDIYLHQAVFSTKLMLWFEKNVFTLSDMLQSRLTNCVK